MNKFLLYSCIIFFVVAKQNVYAQEEISSMHKQEEKISYLNIGLGGSYSTLIDQGISSLVYDGLGGAAIIATVDDGKLFYIQTMARFDFNSIVAQKSGRQMYSYRIEGLADWMFKRLRVTDSRLKVDPGLSLSYQWILRSNLFYTNNAQNIQNSISIGPSTHSYLDFQLFNSQFKIGNLFRLPVMAYVVRPIYTGTQLPGTIDKEGGSWFNYLQGGDMMSWGKYFSINSQTYLQYYFKNNSNAVKLEYFWSFESIESENPVKSGQHAFMISLMVNL